MQLVTSVPVALILCHDLDVFVSGRMINIIEWHLRAVLDKFFSVSFFFISWDSADSVVVGVEIWKSVLYVPLSTPHEDLIVFYVPETTLFGGKFLEYHAALYFVFIFTSHKASLFLLSEMCLFHCCCFSPHGYTLSLTVIHHRHYTKNPCHQKGRFSYWKYLDQCRLCLTSLFS